MRKEYTFYIYIMASNSGTLYTGITNNLEKRVYEHKNDLVEGFSKKYKCHKLIYFEETSDVESAIVREKQIKSWGRKKKENLIRIKNPTWKDLYNDFKILMEKGFLGFARNDRLEKGFLRLPLTWWRSE